MNISYKKYKDLQTTVNPIDSEMKNAINSLTLLFAGSREMKSKIEGDINNLQNPSEIQEKLEEIFKKLQEEIINEKLLQMQFDQSDQKYEEFKLPPSATQDNSLLSVVYVDDVRDRVEIAKTEYEKVKVIFLLL